MFLHLKILKVFHLDGVGVLFRLLSRSLGLGELPECKSKCHTRKLDI